MVSNYDSLLLKREYSLVNLPLNVYCVMSDCNIIMDKGTPVKKYDDATFAHLTCPSGGVFIQAPHKAQTSKYRLSREANI